MISYSHMDVLPQGKSIGRRGQFVTLPECRRARLRVKTPCRNSRATRKLTKNLFRCIYVLRRILSEDIVTLKGNFSYRCRPVAGRPAPQIYDSSIGDTFCIRFRIESLHYSICEGIIVVCVFFCWVYATITKNCCSVIFEPWINYAHSGRYWRYILLYRSRYLG